MQKAGTSGGTRLLGGHWAPRCTGRAPIQHGCGAATVETEPWGPGAGYPPGTRWVRWWHVGGPTQAGKQGMSEVTGEDSAPGGRGSRCKGPEAHDAGWALVTLRRASCHQKPRLPSFLTATPTMATQPRSAHRTSVPTFCARPWQTSRVNDLPPPHRPQLQPRVPWQAIRNLPTTPCPTPLPSQLPADFCLNLTVRPRKMRNKGDGSLRITLLPKGTLTQLAQERG